MQNWNKVPRPTCLKRISQMRLQNLLDNRITPKNAFSYRVTFHELEQFCCCHFCFCCFCLSFFFLLYHKSTRILHGKMMSAIKRRNGGDLYIKSYRVQSRIVPLGWKNSMQSEIARAPHGRRRRLAKAASPGSVCYLHNKRRESRTRFNCAVLSF